MLPEQQRILGYFIEEAADHLQTIERGLLDLQAAIDDPEFANEIFRAAHSLKGGAAMLGLSSIQAISHRLEDHFKLLKDRPIVITHEVESLFLRVFDVLQELVGYLQSGGDLSEQGAALLAETEPVFTELEVKLDQLADDATGLPATARNTQRQPPESDRPQPLTLPLSQPSEEQSALNLIFHTDVLMRLREMLKLFKQPETTETRQAICDLCRVLGKVGDQFELPQWRHLLDVTHEAIAIPSNSFTQLAAIVIKDLKRAQELVLAKREAEISISADLQNLLPLEPDPQDAEEEEIFDLFGDELDGSDELLPDLDTAAPVSTPTHHAAPTPHPKDKNGPEVGVAELTSLADLFETNIGDLDSWDDSHHSDETFDGLFDSGDDASVDGDFADLFASNDLDGEGHDSSANGTIDTADIDIDSLFDDISDLSQAQDEQEARDAAARNTPSENSETPSDQLADDFDDFLGIDVLDNFGDAGGTSGDLNAALDLDDDVASFAGSETELPEFTAAQGSAAQDSANGDDFQDLFDLDLEDEGEPLESSRDLSIASDSDELHLDFNDELNLEPDAGQTSAGDDLLDFDEMLFDLATDSASPIASQTSSPPTATHSTDHRASNHTPSDVDEFDDLFGDLNQVLDEPAPQPADLAIENLKLDDNLDDFDLFGDLGDEFDRDLGQDFGTLDPSNHRTASPSSSHSSTRQDQDDDDLDLSLDDLFDDAASTSTEAIAGGISGGMSGATDETDAAFAGLLADADEDLDLAEISAGSGMLEMNSETSADDFDLFGDLLGDLDREADTPASPIEPEDASLELDGLELDFEAFSDPAPHTSNSPANSQEDFSSDLGDALEDDLNFGDELDEFGDLNDLDLDEALSDVSLDLSWVESEEDSDPALLPHLGIWLSIAPEFIGESDAVFNAIEQFLNQPLTTTGAIVPPAAKGLSAGDDFSDLEQLLLESDLGGPPVSSPPQISSTTLPTTTAPRSSAPARRSRGRATTFEQTMRVPIKQLDDLSNLVGELVVNRNRLEEDQERLRQFLDNLLHQVSQLSEVGQQMQDLYERTLLEMALLASRKNRTLAAQGHAVPETDEFDALEMDKFTLFHEQARDIIELVVRVRESSSDIEFLVDENDQVTRQLRQVTTQLQEGLNRSRMVSFSNATDRLRRGVRDNAHKFGKQVALEIEGQDMLIDRMILEHLYDPLTHLVNNAIAHGIEAPDERVNSQKQAQGTIKISCFNQGNQTIITIADDGAGIDKDKVRSKALQKGLVNHEQARSMTDPEIYNLLFLPGFSTRDKADDLAGRGVGMDVVKTKLNEIRGLIVTDSTRYEGTTFTIRLPLTLSISKALCCISDHAPIAFPMDGVSEVLDNLPTSRIIREGEGENELAYVQWRDQKVPYQPLSNLFTYNRVSSRTQMYGTSHDDDTISVVILRSAGSQLAISVDSIVGEQEIVIKQLEGPVPKPTGITGATVMGDGRIVPIADVLELIDLSMGRVRRDSSSLWDEADDSTIIPAEKSEPMVLIIDDSITVRELLSMTFKKSGYRVEQARDGQEAWEKMRSGLPCELVFCDMEMPRLNGMELLERMHNDDRLSEVPIAMLTSRTAEKMKRRAAELGAKGYFTKPYLEEVLLDAAQRMLTGENLMSIKVEA